MSFFAELFGYVLKFLYNLVNNYGIAIILFSILVKLIMIPMTLKQQKTLKKNEQLQKEMKQLQFKYKNDPEKMNQELMALYKREGMSPFSGCLSAIVQIILLFSVFLLVRSPLTYMVGIDETVIDEMSDVVTESGVTTNSSYREIAIIQYVRNLEKGGSVNEDEADVQQNDVDVDSADTQNNVEENKDSSEENITQEEKETNADSSENEEDIDENNNESQATDEEQEKFDIMEYADQVNLNMDFFGIDLSNVPTQNLNDWKTLIIPVLYVISSFVSVKMSMSNGKKEEEKKLITDGTESEEEYNPMTDANKTMSWMMPIMSISIAIIAPLGLALYWLMNNILMIIEKIIFSKILNKEEEAK